MSHRRGRHRPFHRPGGRSSYFASLIDPAAGPTAAKNTHRLLSPHTHAHPLAATTQSVYLLVPRVEAIIFPQERLLRLSSSR